MYLCWKLALMMSIFVCVTGSYAFHPRGPTRVGVNCCKEVSKARLPPEHKVTGFKHQNALSPCVEAIIVTTEKGSFCADPKAPWIHEVVPGLQKR